MTEERTHTYKPSMAEDRTHAACYHNDVEGVPCEGEMIYFPPVKKTDFSFVDEEGFTTSHVKWSFNGHYSCQGHAYISWGMLAGWEEANSVKRVFPPIGRKEE